jgi:hypothetical protein
MVAAARCPAWTMEFRKFQFFLAFTIWHELMHIFISFLSPAMTGVETPPYISTIDFIAESGRWMEWKLLGGSLGLCKDPARRDMTMAQQVRHLHLDRYGLPLIRRFSPGKPNSKEGDVRPH